MLTIESTALEAALKKSWSESFEQISVLDVIDSTNAEVMRRIQAGQDSHQLLIARSQSSGRGRRGRQWLSPPGAGIYLSLSHAFDQSVEQLQALSLVTALSVQQAITDQGLSGIAVKWPNDVLVENRKVAGILLETCTQGSKTVIIFGIGINLKLPDSVLDEIDRPVSDLSRELGREVQLPDLLHSLLNCWQVNLDRFKAHGFNPFASTWNENDAYFGKQIDVINGNKRLGGKSLGVDNQGALVLATENGPQVISGGEVLPSIRISKGQ